MAAGSIPWTAVSRWAAENGVRDWGRFELLIERMDTEFLKAKDATKDDGSHA